MKLSPAAIAAASISATNAQIKTIWKPNLRQHTNNLLRDAHPYKSNHRRLQDNEMTIDGSYSVQFSRCIDIKTYDENLFGEDIIPYVKTGRVVSTKSYVLFYACQGDDCGGEGDEYIVDLPTFLTAVVEYRADEKENYCKACKEAEEICGNDDAQDDGVVGDDAQDDGGVGDDAAGGTWLCRMLLHFELHCNLMMRPLL